MARSDGEGGCAAGDYDYDYEHEHDSAHEYQHDFGIELWSVRLGSHDMPECRFYCASKTRQVIWPGGMVSSRVSL